MDALSDVLRAVRLTGAIFFDVHASEPWVAETPPGASIVGQMFPGAEHLMSYHVMTRGPCWASVIDGDRRSTSRPATSSSFRTATRTRCPARPACASRRTRRSTVRRATDSCRSRCRWATAETTRRSFVCGFLGCDAGPFNPLLAALPQVIRVSDGAGGAIDAFVQFAVAESKDPRPGGECVLGRLSELMFVDVVRRYLETLPADRTGWLAGLREPFVGRALTALHRDPARGWTLESLAREVGLSRSALAERFAQFVGQPPMQYLANWRMQLAANHLLSGTDSVAAIAERVGYESEAAFSRAFKKSVGAPPSQWRKRRRRRRGTGLAPRDCASPGSRARAF